MIEQIVKGDILFATIIRSEFKTEGIKFFTGPDSPQQIGYMNRAKGYCITAHKHTEIEKIITRSFETLIIRSGTVAVYLYDEDDNFHDKVIVSKGDVVMVGNCGHGFEMLEDSEMIEIKQGPFLGDHETVRINTNNLVCSAAK
ncbi:MAG: hypothetical protein ABIN91_12115 [Mucilaginibacter sp.]|uniref:hypothetical protein n=1 Tax=Mucilaginibacter sp. TaxID=1882438 RepID=UPI003266E9EC